MKKSKIRIETLDALFAIALIALLAFTLGSPLQAVTSETYPYGSLRLIVEDPQGSRIPNVICQLDPEGPGDCVDSWTSGKCRTSNSNGECTWREVPTGEGIHEMAAICKSDPQIKARTTADVKPSFLYSTGDIGWAVTSRTVTLSCSGGTVDCINTFGDYPHSAKNCFGSAEHEIWYVDEYGCKRELVEKCGDQQCTEVHDDAVCSPRDTTTTSIRQTTTTVRQGTTTTISSTIPVDSTTTTIQKTTTSLNEQDTYCSHLSCQAEKQSCYAQCINEECLIPPLSTGDLVYPECNPQNKDCQEGYVWSGGECVDNSEEPFDYMKAVYILSAALLVGIYAALKYRRKR